MCVFVVDESSAKANLALLESDIFIFFAARARPALYAALDTKLQRARGMSQSFSKSGSIGHTSPLEACLHVY